MSGKSKSDILKRYLSSSTSDANGGSGGLDQSIDDGAGDPRHLKASVVAALVAPVLHPDRSIPSPPTKTAEGLRKKKRRKKQAATVTGGVRVVEADEWGGAGGGGRGQDSEGEGDGAWVGVHLRGLGR